ncbi:VanW family protein [Luteolibacter arcticus]|uniref:VanW family protein n=1 Tax=Luteolibacter arcticus TaxID=1581411 RepID=A0ABT3GKB5_9BACT|nr:VanW family protein [Luteolibacter arcticus]MCW1923938.1 VanW family protein [Luteolibacter arcticus]
MSHHTAPERHVPGRLSALAFHLKSRAFQLRRGLSEFSTRPPRHAHRAGLVSAPVIAELRTPLWRELSAAEFPLTAGKVENLRRSARAFHGVEIPASEVFSFWRQLGRTTKAKGFTAGRELREGCLVPAIGGGLCQLSGLLYQAALEAGLEVVERHGHSRVVPGSLAEKDLDATVFWNYVDLRFRSSAPWRLEVELTAADLIVRIRSARDGSVKAAAPVAEPSPRSAPSGDCLTCGMLTCFRHPAATAAHAPSLGHSAFLLDARWPEFDRWCRGHSREGDRWLVPLDGRRWKKPNYQWSPPPGVTTERATLQALLRSWRQRRLPGQGAKRQLALLDGDAALARRYAAMLSPECRHVVVSQNLLPYLWQSGALGGRSFDVLIQRWPMDELQRRLDHAKEKHPQSTTLGDFRADPELVRAERKALAAAARLVTPHRAMARHFGERAWLIDWEMPNPLELQPVAKETVFFPASRLGRKGAFELAAALLDEPLVEVKCFGRATEGAADPFKEIPCSPGTPADLASARVLVLPAWIEHQPRLALLALASGIPVIATEACGLPEHPLMHTLSSPDPAALRMVLRAVLQPAVPACVAS